MKSLQTKRLPPMNTLAAFESAARLGSFTRAAAELHITQAAVSQKVRNLEEWIGCKLFERNRYTVNLNQAGQIFADATIPALQQISIAATSVKSIAHADRQIVIYADLSLAESLLIPRLSEFSEAYPQVEIKLITSSLPLEQESAHVDIGLQYGRQASTRFDSDFISGDDIYPVCSADYFDKSKQPESVAELSQHQLIHLSQEFRQWISWRDFLSEFNVFDDASLSGISISTYTHVLDLAEAGQGIALGWNLAVQPRLQRGSLIRLTNYSMASPEGLYIYFAKGDQSSNYTAAFLEWFKSLQ